MRRIRLLLAAAIICLGVFGFVNPAHAQDEPAGGATTADKEHLAEEAEKAVDQANGDKGLQECVKGAIKGEETSLDTCQEAPNPLLPETNEIIYAAIGFLIVFGFLWKFGYPTVKTTMESRADRIRNDLDSAEAAKTEAQSVLADYRSQLADAKGESNRIIEEARNQAEALKRDQEQRLQAELTEMRQRATSEVEAAKVAAISDLRAEVADMAINAAEVVVQRNLDRQTQLQLVEQYINQVAASRS
jgi:F-type H+-transporting ATPase subunit b